jgi:hypothetical protein
MNTYFFTVKVSWNNGEVKMYRKQEFETRNDCELWFGQWVGSAGTFIIF